MYVETCTKTGRPCDTSSLNAECSEHFNAVLKAIGLKQSNHKKRTGKDGARNIENQLDARCLQPFIHEEVTKPLALRLSMTTNAEVKYANKLHERRNVNIPEGQECRICDQTEAVCNAI